MSRDMERKVLEILTEALDREPGETRLDHSLIDDLEAESIDFLDIQFRLERAFGLKIPDDEIWRGSIDFEDRRTFEDGRLTAAGRGMLEELQPDFAWDRFPGEITGADLPRLITGRTLLHYLKRRLG